MPLYYLFNVFLKVFKFNAVQVTAPLNHFHDCRKVFFLKCKPVNSEAVERDAVTDVTFFQFTSLNHRLLHHLEDVCHMILFTFLDPFFNRDFRRSVFVVYTDAGN